jgi:hypothetical protein
MNWLVPHGELEMFVHRAESRLLEERLSSKTVAHRMQLELMLAGRRTGGPRAIAGWTGERLVWIGERLWAWSRGARQAEQPASLPHFVPPLPGPSIGAVMTDGRQG